MLGLTIRLTPWVSTSAGATRRGRLPTPTPSLFRRNSVPLPPGTTPSGTGTPTCLPTLLHGFARKPQPLASPWYGSPPSKLREEDEGYVNTLISEVGAAGMLTVALPSPWTRSSPKPEDQARHLQPRHPLLPLPEKPHPSPSHPVTTTAQLQGLLSQCPVNTHPTVGRTERPD